MHHLEEEPEVMKYWTWWKVYYSKAHLAPILLGECLQVLSHLHPLHIVAHVLSANAFRLSYNYMLKKKKKNKIASPMR